MKSIIWVGIIAIAMGGCMGLQVGVGVRVVNNCAPFLDLERITGQAVVVGLPYGRSVFIPMTSRPFTGGNRSLVLVAKGYTLTRGYLGSGTRRFDVSIYDGSREDVWEVNEISLPNGRGGCR